MGLPGGSVLKNPPDNTGDAGPIPMSGRSPGEGNGNPLQFYCLGNIVNSVWGDFLPSEPTGKPKNTGMGSLSLL